MIEISYILTASRALKTPGKPNRNGSHGDHVMASKALPSPEVLRQLLRYEPDTGKLFWLVKTPKRRSLDAFCSLHRDGYLQGTVFGVKALAHRVAWAVAHGEWPEHDIDHINGDRTDNRLENLRSVTRKENAHNQKRRATNKSGKHGVHWHKLHSKWCASIMCDGVRKHLGLFANVEAAAHARKIAENELGFHPNHGREA